MSNESAEIVKAWNALRVGIDKKYKLAEFRDKLAQKEKQKAWSMKHAARQR